MVVPIKHDMRKSMWIFVRPFSLDLWLTLGISTTFVGLVLVFLERRINKPEFGGILHQQLFMLLWLPFSMLVFQERSLANKWSKVVLVIWSCVAFIVMQSYTANLSQMLTADRHQTRPAMPKEFRYVGYQEGSYVKELLMKQFNFSESQLSHIQPLRNIIKHHSASPRKVTMGIIKLLLHSNYIFLVVFLSWGLHSRNHQAAVAAAAAAYCNHDRNGSLGRSGSKIDLIFDRNSPFDPIDGDDQSEIDDDDDISGLLAHHPPGDNWTRLEPNSYVKAASQPTPGLQSMSEKGKNVKDSRFGKRRDMSEDYSWREGQKCERGRHRYRDRSKMKMLKVGIPLKRGFTEFVKVRKNHDYTNDEYKVTAGFSIEVFSATLEVLPFKVEPVFYPFLINSNDKDPAATYDDLLKGLPDKSYDIVVGDTTILANRASYVDFTLPYLDSKVFIIVPIKHDMRKSMWTFLKPFSLELWLTVGVTSICVGLVLVILERRVNNTEFRGPLHQQLIMLFCLPLTMLAFRERGLANKWSKVFLVLWLCVAFIVMQSYTANLSLMLTSYQTRPALPKEFRYVGYQEGSFVKELLMKQFNFDESQLKPYSSIKEYHKALSRGSLNGGVDGIYDELPYVNLFLRKYSSKYTKVGPVYGTAGFGFALPLGSTLLPHFSRAILKITGSPKMRELNRKTFGDDYSSHVQPDSGYAENPSLGAYSFIGLFITILLIICSEYSLRVRSINESPPSSTNSLESRVDSSTEMIDVNRACPAIDNYQEHRPETDLSNGEFSTDEEEGEVVVHSS